MGNYSCIIVAILKILPPTLMLLIQSTLVTAYLWILNQFNKGNKSCITGAIVPKLNVRVCVACGFLNQFNKGNKSCITGAIVPKLNVRISVIS